VGKVFFELRGGFAKPGETPEHAARRELLEEVGARTEELRPMAGIVAATINPFIALDSQIVQPT